VKSLLFVFPVFISLGAFGACDKSSEAIVVAGNDACPARRHNLPDCAVPASVSDSRGSFKYVCENQ
jgi:hypothetical protein